jgi:hypothetical protein
MTETAGAESQGQVPGTRTRGSIARRMLVGAAVWSLAVIVAAGWSLQALYVAETEQRLDQDVDAAIFSLTSAVDSDESGALVIDAAQLPNDPRFTRALSGWYWAILSLDAANLIVDATQSPSFFDARPEPTVEHVASAISQRGVMVHEDAMGPDDSLLRVGLQAVMLPDRAEPILLYAAIDRTAADDAHACRQSGACAEDAAGGADQ